jgi:hypothetical protein
MRTDPHKGNVDIEYGHHLVHMALLDFASDASTGVTSVVYGIFTGALPLHLAMRVLLSTGGTLVVTEGLTGTMGGSPINWGAYNRVDNPGTRKLKSALYKTPTGLSAGAALPTINIPANVERVIPAAIRSGVEFNLNPNTNYTLTFTLPSGNANVDFEAYEEAAS